MNEMTYDTVNTVIAWIDEHLDDDLTLEDIARHAGYSPFHFSRMFLARTRRSVMAYVRGRRLVRGASRLLSEPRLRLIDLALDCGFESQEAFTRAFRRLFGTTPARFRQGFAVEPLEGQFPMHVSEHSRIEVAPLPALLTREQFVVAGPCRRFDDTSKFEIPQLWSKLIGALPFPGQVGGRASYGVVSSVDRTEGSFMYLAGVQVDADIRQLPAGFERMIMPPATYMVFRITLDGGPIHLQVKDAMREVWGRLIPASGHTPAGTPDFELYNGDQSLTEAGATIDYHVPVKT